MVVGNAVRFRLETERNETMNRYWKIISLCLALLCLPFALLACNGEGSALVTTNGTTTATTQAATTAATTAAPALTLKIGSYNIAAGKKINYDMTVFGKQVKDTGLDIVGFQEVDYMTNRNQKQDTMKIISESSGLAHYAYFKAIDYQGGEYGLGILSRYPILSTELIKLESGSKEQRILAHAVIDVEGTPVDFFVTHLTHNDTDLRNGQFRQIAEILKNYDTFILTGDFNTSVFADYNVIRDAGKVNHAQNKLITFPSKSTPLDNIVYHDKAWQFTNAKVVQNTNSDHYMLYATMEYIKEKSE